MVHGVGEEGGRGEKSGSKWTGQTFSNFYTVLFCVSAVDFISDVTLGKVPPLLKSAPPPENPCLRSGSLNSACIWELTAETFTQAVMNTNEVVYDVCLHVSHFATHARMHAHTHFV